MSPYNARYPVHDLLASSPCSPTTPLHAPPYDVRGRQQQFIETAQQRRARLEFLKKREWARRVAEWIRETSARQDVMSFGCTGSLAASSSRSDNIKMPRYTIPVSPPPLPSREEEEEPYIIYSSSPSSSMSSLSDDLPVSSTLALHPPVSTNTLSGTIPSSKRAHHRRRSSASLVDLHRRPSLSSIYEVPEED